MQKIVKTYTAHQKGILALILVAFIYASIGVFSRYLSTSFTLLQQVYLRVLAALLLGFVFFRSNLDFKKLTQISPKEWCLLVFRAALDYGVGVVLFTLAVLNTKLSNVSFIGAVPMVAIFGVVLLKEKLTLKKAILLITAFLGVILIGVKDYANILVWGQGELYALFSSLCFSLSLIARKWHTDLLNNQENAQLIFLLSFLMLLGASLFKGEGLPLTGWHIGVGVAIIGAGIFNVIRMFLVNYGFQKVKAVVASNTLNLESLFGLVLGVLFYQEVPLVKELVGGVIIVASVIAMNKLETKD